jgi:class 3 adenylate cyclase
MSQTPLAAILAADVVGYSRLMGADEEGTLERLKALRREYIDPKLVQRHGRIAKTTGDGLLVEFASVVDAVRCAAAVQQAMPGRNADVPADRRIKLRIVALRAVGRGARADGHLRRGQFVRTRRQRRQMHRGVATR